ncbi:MAG: filamentous hemagglutinin N-terminal domain-containing protein [Chlamydiales bacterium]|nr:filamentous hemagglutinin N-terminal domain-containing protein [Chlamydiales bacterium]
MDKHTFFLWVLAPLSLFAKPTGPDVAQGHAVFSHPTKHQMHIQVDDQTIINWNDFSIQEGETTRFIQPSQNATVLNRVTGSHPSNICGTLQANGNVYLINPKGVFIGNGALIDTNTFIASTLDLLDSEFMQGKDLRFRGNSENSVVNLGTIRAKEGDVALIGRTVENYGSIKAPSGYGALVVGKEILLKPSDQNRFHICALSQNQMQKGTGIINKGSIEALKIHLLADGNPYKLAIKHEGTLDALTCDQVNGEIFLIAENGAIEAEGLIHSPAGNVRILGEKVALLGKTFVDLSAPSGGGEFLFGGSYKGRDRSILHSQYSYVSPETKIDVSATEVGKGGKSVIWSDGLTSFHGVVLAKGGNQSGDGGMIEISGKMKLDNTGHIDRSATIGQPGEYLTDPSTLMILKNRPVVSTSYIQGTFYPTQGVSYLDEVTLFNQLNNGPVTIVTTSSFPGDGDIIIDTDLDTRSSGGGYGGKHLLTLSADRDIVVKGSVQNSGYGTIRCEAKRDLLLDSSSRPARLGSQMGDVDISVGRNILLLGGEGGGAQIGYDNGLIKSNIHMEIGGDLILQSANQFTIVGHTNTIADTAGSDFTGNITISHLGGDLVLLAGNGEGQFAQIGHAPRYMKTYSSTQNFKAEGNITIPNMGGEVKVVAGQGGEGSYALIGHGGMQRSHDHSYKGTITLDAGKDITLIAGLGETPNRFAGIGFGQDFEGSALHTFHSDNVSVTAGGKITFHHGDGTNPAFIGAYTGNTPGKMDCQLHQLSVVAKEGIVIKGNPQNFGDAAIGIVGMNGPAIANINIDAGKGLFVSGGKDSHAYITNVIGNPATRGSIQITGDVISFDNSFIQGSGPVTVLARQSLIFKSHGAIENRGGPITITSYGDALFSPESMIANTSNDPINVYVSYQRPAPYGALTLAEGSLLEGPTTLYLTSQVAHELYTTSPFTLTTDEVIETPLPPETPHSLFYKNGTFAYHTIERSQLLVSEMLNAFHSLSEPLGWMEWFQVGDQSYYTRCQNRSISEPKNSNLLTYPKAL